MLHESVELIQKLWRGDYVTCLGKYYHVHDAICLPRPVQQPHPPIWVGGSSERTLKIVAEFADACNLFGDLEMVKKKLVSLSRYCSVVQRNFDDLIKSKHFNVLIGNSNEEVRRKFRLFIGDKADFQSFSISNLVGTPEECTQKIQEYVTAGIDYFTLNFPDAYNPETLELLSDEVISQFVVA